MILFMWDSLGMFFGAILNQRYRLHYPRNLSWMRKRYARYCRAKEIFKTRVHLIGCKRRIRLEM